ncbi:hypothetical protein EVAR_92941_1 [Eumeta japonica]|uniref:Uncharacterized protein n=1 Tax=Eumeta variegata TaxID=151549 RepID=A0A4C1TCY2_EUMVA|nr:hypothetical protein EVAR_92941_1 [Eumeta japonica]
MCLKDSSSTIPVGHSWGKRGSVRAIDTPQHAARDGSVNMSNPHVLTATLGSSATAQGAGLMMELEGGQRNSVIKRRIPSNFASFDSS